MKKFLLSSIFVGMFFSFSEAQNPIENQKEWLSKKLIEQSKYFKTSAHGDYEGKIIYARFDDCKISVRSESVNYSAFLPVKAYNEGDLGTLKRERRKTRSDYTFDLSDLNADQIKIKPEDNEKLVNLYIPLKDSGQAVAVKERVVSNFNRFNYSRSLNGINFVISNEESEQISKTFETVIRQCQK